MPGGLPTFKQGQNVLSAIEMTRLVQTVIETKSRVDILNVSFDSISLQTISIKNVTGSALSRFHIVGLGDAIFNPANDFSQFRSSMLLKGETPTTAAYIGNFAIMLDPCEDGAYGRAVAAGSMVCQINMNHADDKYADVKNADATMLDSTPVGTARIIWVESGTGTKWAVVVLGDTFPRVLKATNDAAGGSVTVKAVDSAGDVQGGEITLAVLP